MSTNIFSFVLKYPLKQTEKSTRDFALLCIMHLDVVITSLRLYCLVMWFLYSISDFLLFYFVLIKYIVQNISMPNLKSLFPFYLKKTRQFYNLKCFPNGYGMYIAFEWLFVYSFWTCKNGINAQNTVENAFELIFNLFNKQ